VPDPSFRRQRRVRRRPSCLAPLHAATIRVLQRQRVVVLGRGLGDGQAVEACVSRRESVRGASPRAYVIREVRRSSPTAGHELDTPKSRSSRPEGVAGVIRRRGADGELRAAEADQRAAGAPPTISYDILSPARARRGSHSQGRTSRGLTRGFASCFADWHAQSAPTSSSTATAYKGRSRFLRFDHGVLVPRNKRPGAYRRGFTSDIDGSPYRA